MMNSDPASAAHSRIRLSGSSSFTTVQGLRRRDEAGKRQNLLLGVLEPIAIPAELVSQNPDDFFNNRLRHGNFNVAIDGHMQESHAAELKGGNVDIGIEGDPSGHDSHAGIQIG